MFERLSRYLLIVKKGGFFLKALVNSRVVANVTRILGYLFAIFMAYLFSLYLNARIGWMFVVLFAVSPVFSVLVTAVLKRRGRITLSADSDATLIYKNETVALRIKVFNKGFLPIPVVILGLFTPVCLKREDAADKGRFAVSVSPRSETAFEVRYKAKVWGSCVLGINHARLQDFMRFSGFTLYTEQGEALYSHTVKIIPDIPDIPADSPIIKSTFNAAWYNDNEDTKESQSYMLSGIPGYTHREYEEGDPIKRINWKLSAGRDSYLIRLDDEKESIQQTIALDMMGSADPYVNERAVEGVLAVVFSLIRLGVESTVWYKKGGLFVSHSIESQADVLALQTAFAEYSFMQDISGGGRQERVPAVELTEGKNSGNLLLFTPLPDRELAALISEMRSKGAFVTTISADYEYKSVIDNLWKLFEDYTAVKVN